MSVVIGLAVLSWAITLFAFWILYRLLVDRGRLLLQLEDREREFLQAERVESAPTVGLASGSMLSDFELPTVSGERMTLTQWRGKRVILIFFSPTSRQCLEMLPGLAALDPEPADGRPIPLILSTGDPEVNRALVEKHRVACPVMLQDDVEVALIFRVPGTPMAYLLDETGRTVGDIVIGPHRVLEVANSTAGTKPAEFTPYARGRFGMQGDRNLKSLTVGAPAPDFTIPCAGGGQVSLAEFRGHRTLVVFTDPLCRPCVGMHADLVRAADRTPGIKVLLVSCGGPGLNEEMVREHRIRFPVGLQDAWSVSLAFGMLATPIAYLIDETGVIEAEVLIGAKRILSALTESAAEVGAGARDG